MKWFQKELPKVPQGPVNYPSDIIVQTELATYFIKGKSKLRVFSDRCLDSWSMDVVQGSEASVSKFKKAGVLGFRPGTLVKDISNSKIYIISDNTRRHITNPDVFDLHGIDYSKAMVVSSEEINLHPEGEVLS